VDLLTQLGVRRVINGNATLTRLGGSLMPPCVLDAMRQGAAAFVEMDELHNAVGREIARLTHNESCYVTCGCAAGLVLSVAALLAGDDETRRAQLPHTDGLKNELVGHRKTRVGYDFALRQAGGVLVEIGDEGGATAEQLSAALSPRTAGVFYFPNAARDSGTVPLKEAVCLAHDRGIPVVVDAAAQLPPRDNLWKYTNEYGADLVLFSGGKGLRGPQASGLMLGREDLTRAAAFHAGWRPFLGRPMKVGKEELCGVLGAVQWYLEQDEAALLQCYEDQVAYAIRELDGHFGVTAGRRFPSEAGQPMPRAEVSWPPNAAITARVRQGLSDHDPVIDLAWSGDSTVLINPQTLQDGEMDIIVDCLRRLLGRS
jgi:L-seryl-tRNA(Ser) seleniumtransferase